MNDELMLEIRQAVRPALRPYLTDDDITDILQVVFSKIVKYDLARHNLEYVAELFGLNEDDDE